MYLPYNYYRNSEKYADPTAGEAMMNIMLEQKKQQEEQKRRMYERIHRPKVYIVSKYAGDIEANTAAIKIALKLKKRLRFFSVEQEEYK